MKYRKILFPSFLIILFFTGCGAGNHTVQSDYSEYQSSTQKGKNEMYKQNNMLNEIFSTRITNISTQRIDVSHIVLQYIPLGIHKDELTKLISQNFELLENSNYKLTAHQFKGEGHLGNRRDIYIEFFFDGNKKLNNISAYLDKSNNL